MRRLPEGEEVSDLRLEPELLSGASGAGLAFARPLPLAEIPPHLTAAILAVEDRRFLSHGGLDLRAIARAAWVNLRHGELLQGGSTVTQQLAKTLYLTPHRTFWRKVREAVLANVRASVQQLRHGSELLERLIESDGLLVVGAKYSLATGVVSFLEG